MSMYFDPIKSRKNAYSSEMMDFYVAARYDSNIPIGNCSRSDLGYVIGGVLVGRYEKLSSILSRCVTLLDEAIDKDEEFGEERDLHRMNLHWARAIAGWMNDGYDHPGSWENARVYEEAAWRYEKRPWPRNEIINDGLDDYMAFAYQAAEPDEGVDGYEIAIDMYEHWLGEKPVSLKKTLKPREFAYALCLHFARNQFELSELLMAGRKMLQANLEKTWFEGGQYIRGATWLKIVYGISGEKLSPLQTILKAYDNMPHVERPDFV